MGGPLLVGGLGPVAPARFQAYIRSRTGNILWSIWHVISRSGEVIAETPTSNLLHLLTYLY